MSWFGSPNEIEDEQDIRHEGAEFGEGIGPPGGVIELDATKAQQGTDDSHEGSTGNETRGDEVAFLATGFVGGLVLGTRGNIPADGTADDQGDIEFHGDEHTQGKGQGGNLAQREHHGNDGTNGV